MKENNIILHLKIILISFLIGSLFALPVYISWQSDRDYLKARFNIVDENDMNKTQALGLELIDNWGIGKVIFIFSLVSGLAFIMIEGLVDIRKHEVTV